MDLIKESRILKNYDVYREYMDDLRKNVDKTSKSCFKYDWKEMHFHIDSDYYKVVLLSNDNNENAIISKYDDKKMMHKVEQTRFIYVSDNEKFNMHFEYSSIKPLNLNQTIVNKKDAYYLDNVCVELKDKSIILDNDELNKIYNVNINISEIIEMKECRDRVLKLTK